MSDNGKWADINKAGSGNVPATNSDSAPEAQEAIDNANKASRLHAEADKLADRSGK